MIAKTCIVLACALVGCAFASQTQEPGERIADFLETHAQGETEADYKAALEALLSKEQSWFGGMRKKGVVNTIKDLLSMETSAKDCSQNGYNLMNRMVDLTNDRSYHLAADARKIDKYVNFYLRAHANNCKSEVAKEVKLISKRFDGMRSVNSLDRYVDEVVFELTGQHDHPYRADIAGLITPNDMYQKRPNCGKAEAAYVGHVLGDDFEGESEEEESDYWSEDQLPMDRYKFTKDSTNTIDEIHADRAFDGNLIIPCRMYNGRIGERIKAARFDYPLLTAEERVDNYDKIGFRDLYARYNVCRLLLVESYDIKTQFFDHLVKVSE